MGGASTEDAGPKARRYGPPGLKPNSVAEHFRRLKPCPPQCRAYWTLDQVLSRLKELIFKASEVVVGPRSFS